MHLEHGAVTPGCAAVTFGAAGLVVGYAGVVLRKEAKPMANLGLAAALGSAVFVAQMINFPISNISSAHLVGGALLAWVLRPAVGLLTMSMVLVVQALFMGDGGLMSLGANILNMAVVPALAVVAVRAVMNRPGQEMSRAADFAGLASASFIATVAGAATLVGQVGLFRTDFAGADFSAFSNQMLLTHSYIGVTEAALACVALALVRFVSTAGKQSPVDEFAGEQPASNKGQLVIGTLAVLMLALVPFGSELHDGYQAAAHATGLDKAISGASEMGYGLLAIQETFTGVLPASPIANAAAVTLVFAAGLLFILWSLGRVGKRPATSEARVRVDLKSK